MGERVRGAIFNFLGNDWEGKIALDLFAGSGALGIESLSRGAKKAILVEKNAKVIEILRNNLASLGVDNAKIVKYDALDFTSIERFDVVFVDPPYEIYDGICEKLSEKLDTLAVQKRAVLVVSRPKKSVALKLANWKIEKSRDYADATVDVFDAKA